jgi:hypothetical protein
MPRAESGDAWAALGAAGRRAAELRADLEGYRLNVRCGRIEADDEYEDSLASALADAERADRDALSIWRQHRSANPNVGTA